MSPGICGGGRNPAMAAIIEGSIPGKGPPGPSGVMGWWEGRLGRPKNCGAGPEGRWGSCGVMMGTRLVW